MTSLFKGLNLTKAFNVTSLIAGLNLTSLLDKFNLTNIFSGKTDAGNNTNKDSNSSSNWWDDIFGKKDSDKSIIDSIIDWIKGKGSSNNADDVAKDSIKSANLKTYYDKTTTFKVTVMSGNKAVTKGTVVFKVNNKKITANIGSNGVATLKIKLKPGTYKVTSTYGKVSVNNNIVVKKSIITKNVSKKYKKAGKFKVKVLNAKGKAQAKQKVKIKFKGKTYTVKTNKKGIATFKLSKKLKVGKYAIKTTCKGLTVSNKITVKK